MDKLERRGLATRPQSSGCARNLTKLISMNNFIENCLTGDAQLDEIDDYIDRWHEGQSVLPLHTYLGMSQAEYAAWIESPDRLSEIIAVRKAGHKDTKYL